MKFGVNLQLLAEGFPPIDENWLQGFLGALAALPEHEVICFTTPSSDHIARSSNRIRIIPLASPLQPSALFQAVNRHPHDLLLHPYFWICPPQICGPQASFLPAVAPESLSSPLATLSLDRCLTRADLLFALEGAEPHWRPLTKKTDLVVTGLPSDPAAAATNLVEASAQWLSRHQALVDPYPLVSIVTPSYQQGKFIERTILSVLNQDYPNLEYIVVDGGSQDETIEVLRRHDERIRWISKKDRGQSDAINRGLRAARGEIVAYLNSDDTYEPGAIRRAVQHLLAHPDCDVVYGRAWNIDEGDGIIGPYPTEYFDPDRLREICFICQPSAFWRRDLHADVGYFDEDVHFVMDYEFWIRAAARGRFGFVDEYQANNRVWGGAKSSESRGKQIRQAMQIVHRNYRVIPDYWIGLYLDMAVSYPGLTLLPKMMRPAYRRWLRTAYKFNLLARYHGIARSLRMLWQAHSFPHYSDGWIGRRFETRVARSKSAARLRLSGRSSMWPFKSPPELTVKIEGITAATLRIPFRGDFVFDIPLPAQVPDNPTLKISLASTATFIPAAQWGGGDYRELSVIIFGIELRD